MAADERGIVGKEMDMEVGLHDGSMKWKWELGAGFVGWMTGYSSTKTLCPVSNPRVQVRESKSINERIESCPFVPNANDLHFSFKIGAGLVHVSECGLRTCECKQLSSQA